MGVIDYINKRLDKHLENVHEEEPIVSSKDTIPKQEIPEIPPIHESVEIPEMEPSAFTKKLNPDARQSKVLRDIDESNFEDVLKHDTTISSDAVLDSELDTDTISPNARSEKDYYQIPVPDIKSSESNADNIRKTSTIDTSGAPKVEAPKLEWVDATETPNTSVLPEPKEYSKDSGTGTLKSSKLIDIAKTFGTSAYKNLKGSPESDMEYARRGGYSSGFSKEDLESDIETFKKRNELLRNNIDNIDRELDVLAKNRIEVAEGIKTLKFGSRERDSANTELRRIDLEIGVLNTKRDKVDKSINDNNDEIRKRKTAILQYQKFVDIGKSKPSAQRTVINKKLQNLGLGAETVRSGVYDARVGKNDWFGREGFMKAPYKQSTMTSNIVQPVKPHMSSLDAITRSTGAVVGHGMVDAVTTVRANKVITPFGVPGTVYGAKKQFDYHIPAKRITPSDVTTNINRDLLPSIFSPPKRIEAPMTQYQQVVQTDGSIANVPVQQRKQKRLPILVTRFNRGMNPSTLHGLHNDSRFVRGINSVGYKPVRIASGGKKAVVTEKTKFHLGFIDLDHMSNVVNKHTNTSLLKDMQPVGGFNSVKEQKNDTPKVAMKFAFAINGNLNKFLIKRKTK